MMTASGLRPTKQCALLASWNEFGSGLLVLLGLLTPLAGIGLAAGMAMAVALVHGKNGFWNSNGGYEFNLVVIAAAIALVLTGLGKHSLDAALGP